MASTLASAPKRGSKRGQNEPSARARQSDWFAVDSNLRRAAEAVTRVKELIEEHGEDPTLPNELLEFLCLEPMGRKRVERASMRSMLALIKRSFGMHRTDSEAWERAQATKGSFKDMKPYFTYFIGVWRSAFEGKCLDLPPPNKADEADEAEDLDKLVEDARDDLEQLCYDSRDDAEGAGAPKLVAAFGNSGDALAITPATSVPAAVSADQLTLSTPCFELCGVAAQPHTSHTYGGHTEAAPLDQREAAADVIGTDADCLAFNRQGSIDEDEKIPIGEIMEQAGIFLTDSAHIFVAAQGAATLGTSPEQYNEGSLLSNELHIISHTVARIPTAPNILTLTCPSLTDYGPALDANHAPMISPVTTPTPPPRSTTPEPLHQSVVPGVATHGLNRQCKYPDCSRECCVKNVATGQLHDYCGFTHAMHHKHMLGQPMPRMERQICALRGCSRLAGLDSRGTRQFRYCSHRHYEEAVHRGEHTLPRQVEGGTQFVNPRKCALPSCSNERHMGYEYCTKTCALSAQMELMCIQQHKRRPLAAGSA